MVVFLVVRVRAAGASLVARFRATESPSNPSRTVCQALRMISTGELRVSPRFHFRPINVVVYHDPSRENSSWEGLGA